MGLNSEDPLKSRFFFKSQQGSTTPLCWLNPLMYNSRFKRNHRHEGPTVVIGRFSNARRVGPPTPSLFKGQLYKGCHDREIIILKNFCSQYASKFGKLSSGHRTGKGQFSFHFQRKAMPKNAQTAAQLHSFHMLTS